MNKDFKSNFSLILLIGLVMKKVPLRFLQPFLQRSLEIMLKKHSAIFKRLNGQNFDFTIDAIDLPFVFYLKPSLDNPVLRAIRREETFTTSATIRGEFLSLLALFEGKLDGDAAFFSKELIIEGSTAASVALRNAIDGEEMDIVADLSEIFAPFDSIFFKVVNKTTKKYMDWQGNLDVISAAITNKVTEKIKIHDLQINDIMKELDSIEEKLSKINKEQIRKKSDYAQIT